MVALSKEQTKSVKIWTGITGVIWLAYIILRLTVGGNCERPSLVENFDAEQYLGNWYEMYRSKSVIFEEDDCATATYRELDRNYIEVNNIEFSISE